VTRSAHSSGKAATFTALLGFGFFLASQAIYLMTSLPMWTVLVGGFTGIGLLLVSIKIAPARGLRTPTPMEEPEKTAARADKVDR